jgi:putative Mg2+ transporter-C (MgtC) family protein
MLYEVRGTDSNDMFAKILEVLDKSHIRLNILERDTVGAVERVTFAVSASSHRHRDLLDELRASDATDHVTAFRDAEED